MKYRIYAVLLAVLLSCVEPIQATAAVHPRRAQSNCCAQLIISKRIATCTINIKAPAQSEITAKYDLYRINGAHNILIKSWSAHCDNGKLHRSKRIRLMQKGFYRIKLTTVITADRKSKKYTAYSAKQQLRSF